MITFSLNSGSNGNSIYVEAGDVRLLFDAGVSGACARTRMAAHGRDIREVDALIISHEHSDHIAHAGVYHRKFGFPLYLTYACHRAMWGELGKLRDVRHFRGGEPLTFGPVTVYTLRTPHDAVETVAFVVEHEGKRLGIFTDLGHPFAGLTDALESVDGAYLECNYDPGMLENGPYPLHLKARIRGPRGHLSNEESSQMMRQAGDRRPRWIAMAHLSERNNHPGLAFEAQRRAVGRDYPVYLAPRYEVSPVFEL